MKDHPDYSDDAATAPTPLDEVDEVATTSPEPVVTHDAARTNPMPAVSAEPPTDPVHDVPPAIEGFDIPTTEMRRPDTTADPDDETGYVPALQSGLVEPPTTELQRDEFRAHLRDPSEDQTLTEDNETRERMAADLGVLRRTAPPATVGTTVKPPPPAVAGPPNSTRAAPLLPVASQSQDAAPRPLPENRSRFVRAFWKSESFWQVRPPTEAALVKELPAAFAARMRRATIAAVIGGLLGGVLVLLIARGNWLEPFDVLFLSLLAVLPVAVVVGAVGRPLERPPTVHDARALLPSLGAGAVLLLVVPLPWQLGFVRELLRPAHDDLAMTRAMLSDRSDGVALAECVAVGARFTSKEIVEAIASGLRERPEVAVQCLQALPDVADQLGARLVETWSEGVIDAQVPAEQACDSARALLTMTRPPGEVELPLLACIGAAPAAAQTCCGEALQSRTAQDPKWVGAVTAQRSPVPDARAAGAILELAFGTADRGDASRQLVKQAGIERPAAQEMALALGCAATRDGAAPGDGFVVALQGCAINAAELPRDQAFWADVCARADEPAARRTSDPRQRFCAAATRAAAER